MCRLENDFIEKWKPDDSLDRYGFSANKINGKYGLAVNTWDSLPPEKVFRDVSLDKRCEIDIIAYGEENTKILKRAKFKSGITMNL